MWVLLKEIVLSEKLDLLIQTPVTSQNISEEIWGRTKDFESRATQFKFTYSRRWDFPDVGAL